MSCGVQVEETVCLADVLREFPEEADKGRDLSTRRQRVGLTSAKSEETPVEFPSVNAAKFESVFVKQ